MKLKLKRYLAVIALAQPFGCVVYDANADAGVVADGGVDDVDAGFDPVDDCPDDVCAEGCADTIDGLCLPARIDADAPFALTTLNQTCRGSTCTIVQTSVCDVRVDGDRVVVGGSVCFANDPDSGGSCSEDCGGASGGSCAVTALSAGTWTFVVGGVEREVTVPFVREPANTDDCFGAGF